MRVSFFQRRAPVCVRVRSKDAAHLLSASNPSHAPPSLLLFPLTANRNLFLAPSSSLTLSPSLLCFSFRSFSSDPSRFCFIEKSRLFRSRVFIRIFSPLIPFGLCYPPLFRSHSLSIFLLLLFLSLAPIPPHFIRASVHYARVSFLPALSLTFVRLSPFYETLFLRFFLLRRRA